MSSLLEDDTRYVKLWLLLVKGGTYVFKKHTQKILDNDNTTIDVCLEKYRDKLSKVNKIYPKLWELLCSNSKDIDVLDISAHAYVLLNLFGKKLNAVEKVVLTKLRDKRNELGHRGDRPLPEKDFLREWSEVTKLLDQLSTGLSSNDQDYVETLTKDIWAILYLKKATYELKTVENQDDFVKDILAKQQSNDKRRLDYLTQHFCEFERDIQSGRLGLDELTRLISELEEFKRNVGTRQLDKQFVVEYRYLLLETGNYVLRRVFNHIVGPNLKVYLDKHPDRMRDFNNLLSSRNILTPVQLQLLPPIDNSPSSDKFDITLLSCLLRYTCGLCSSSDQVWSNPQSTDTSLEADITRLRICRNELAHSESVFEDETVLNTKWKDLCEILKRLARRCGFPIVNAVIQKEGYIDIDEKLQEKWRNVFKSDIQKILIDAYQNNICSSLPLFPLLEYEKCGLLELYEVPTMYVVNYHKVEKQHTDKFPDNVKKVKTCFDLFHVKDKDFKNIYLTGDAGVGKTSFCKFLSLLWCKSKLGERLEKVDMQEYIDYLARFEFVFFVNLRDTHSTDLIAIIVNQLFYSENKYSSNRMYDIVKEILDYHDSLVIMDGFDELTPKLIDKRAYEIPFRPKSLKCVYLTTCRPYKIENVRLSLTDLDHQVQMTGLGYKEIRAHISNLIRRINFKFGENKNQEEFMMAVEEVNILDMLHIPMTTLHLVFLWFDRLLTSMSKSLIYGNIMDMLFKLAHKKEIVIQQSKSSKLKLPERLSELTHFKDHFSQVEPLCLLSFKLLFEHDTDITSIVITRDQLASELYCLSEEETNFFCTIGILSKNKVNRKFGKQEFKLKFLHKSYLEFFAAIYVSTLDTSNVLELFSQCRTIKDVLKYENFLIFYAGLSIDSFVSLMTSIYSLISKNLDLTRVKSIFFTSDDSMDKRDQLFSLQDLILKCNIEGSYQIGTSLPLEDFTFSSKHLTDTETKYLRKLILLNTKKVGLLRSDTGEYFDEFDHLTGLKGLCIYEYDNTYNREFNVLIKQNKSSLQIINIRGMLDTRLSLPLEDLHYLTSLSLRAITMSHDDIQYLTKFLSNNRQLKHVRLENVRCTEHDWISYDVCGSFELLQCNKLVYLNIDDTNIVLTNINTSSLEYIKVRPYSKSIARSYIDIVNSIQNALELKHLDIHGRDMLDDYLVDTLMTNVQYLCNIESIELSGITIRDNVSFLLHPSVKQVSIILSAVNMTARWFQTFIESVIYKHCCIKLELAFCIIRQNYGDTKGDMSREESVDYIHDYIKSISAVQIVEYDSSTLPHNIEFVINDYQ